MSLPAYPSPAPPGPPPAPWPRWRMLQSVTSGSAVGLGVSSVATAEHLWRFAPGPRSLASAHVDPGLAAGVALVVAGAAGIGLATRGADKARFARLRAAAVGARRPPAQGNPTRSAALFVTVGPPRLRAAAATLGWAALVVASALVFRTWLLPAAIGAVLAVYLLRSGPLRVGIGPSGVTVRSWLGWRLAHVPLDTIATAGVAYLDLASLGGPVAGRLWGCRPPLAAWVRRDSPALSLELSKGGLVVLGIPDATRAASLVAGLAGLSPGSTGPGGLDRTVPAFPGHGPADRLDADARRALLELLGQRWQGNEVKAMKLVRDRTGCSLREARSAVEGIASSLHPGP
ncbi:MAG: hypothetical protein M0T80_02945 [Actinomycetota bacterium]|nr:hypothetical protein [Actinomycetota bacterium]